MIEPDPRTVLFQSHGYELYRDANNQPYVLRRFYKGGQRVAERLSLTPDSFPKSRTATMVYYAMATAWREYTDWAPTGQAGSKNAT